MTFEIKNNRELIFALLYVFRFVAKINPAWDKNGNYDILLLFAFVIFINFVIPNRAMLNVSILRLLPFVFMELFIVCFSKQTVSILQFIWWIGKMYLCTILMCVTEKNVYNFDLQKFINYSVRFYGVIFAVAMVYRTRLLWHLGDNRLEFFYTEPSELSIYGALLLLTQIAIFFQSKGKTQLVNIAFLTALIILCGGMAGVMAGSLAIVLLIVGELVKSLVQMRFRVRARLLFFAVGLVVGIAVVLLSDNPISNRLALILSGMDSSFGTRSNYNYNTLNLYLAEHHGVGIGLGNMDNIMDLLGKSYRLTAAYPLFFLEGGLLAIAYTLVLNFSLLRSAIRKHSWFSVSLLVFTNACLIFGSWFLNPIVWMIFGVLKAPRLPQIDKTQ